MLLPSTELHVVAADANGVTKTFDSNASDPADRPRGIQFATQLQSGFYTGGFDLRRQIDRDNDDLHKLDDIKFMGADGDTAYEGYVGGLPRSMDETTHTLGVTTAGWIAHASDEPFRAIFVDRDVTAWIPPSRARKIDMMTASLTPVDFEIVRDSTGKAGITTPLVGAWASPLMPICEAWYDAGSGLNVGELSFSWQREPSFPGVVAPWSWVAFIASDDQLGASTSTAELRAAGPDTNGVTRTDRYAGLRFTYAGTPAGVDGGRWAIGWYDIAVRGDHGLPKVGATPPFGVAASDVVRYLVGRYVPLLSTAGVRNSSYPIGHLVFKEDTTVYDALLKLNSYHQWKLAVWEDRTLHFEPIDLTDWDWEVRHDEIGTTIGLQGDSVEGLRNGIKVQFTNVATGAVETLHPDDYPELRDDSIDNPASQHGRRMYGTPFVIPFPTIAADALELGRAKLAQDLQPKAPGSFTINRYVRDRSGTWQPAWKVRAGDRVRLTSTLNLSDRPRLIHETSYNHDSGTLTIAVDATLQILEAIFDRQQTARQAAGLA